MRNITSQVIQSKIFPIRQESQRAIVQLEKLAIHCKSAIQFIDYDDILYCKADSNYTEVHLQSGERVVSSLCLKTIESKITSDLFLRIHASYLVNLSKMSELRKTSGWHMTINDVQLPIARSRFANLKIYLNL